MSDLNPKSAWRLFFFCYFFGLFRMLNVWDHSQRNHDTDVCLLRVCVWRLRLVKGCRRFHDHGKCNALSSRTFGNVVAQKKIVEKCGILQERQYVLMFPPTRLYKSIMVSSMLLYRSSQSSSSLTLTTSLAVGPRKRRLRRQQYLLKTLCQKDHDTMNRNNRRYFLPLSVTMVKFCVRARRQAAAWLFISSPAVF